MIKKILSVMLVSCLFGLSFSPAFAKETQNVIKDVANDYWAKQEIERVVADSIMSIDEEGNFCPEKDMTRIEFVQALLKVLSNENLNVEIKNSFTDVQETDAFYADVLRSEQLGLVYGYPDNTFKPNNVMLRSEVTSVISHITKERFVDCATLNVFTDKKDIPDWAKIPYAKALHYGIFVNPTDNLLAPNKNITRAETAVILSKLKDKLTVVKPEYIGPKEEVLSVEHITTVETAPCNTVTITNLRKIISKGDVLTVAFDSAFESKKHVTGDTIYFNLPEALYTEEGTFLLPAQTKLTAEITKIENPQKYNKNARIHLAFKGLVLPDGSTITISGTPFTKNSTLIEGPWATAGNIALWTVGVNGGYTAADLCCKFIPSPVLRGAAMVVGVPLGAVAGIVGWPFMPGLNYNAKAGETLLLLLNDDVIIQRTK